ncbi:MAG: DUF362 domain-containing protein [Candidatus Latescibacterota bacterium]
MINRRRFLQSAVAAGGAAPFAPLQALGSRYQSSTGFFGLHSFIENHPNSVFIMKTGVDVKTNGAAIKQTALQFARSVFVPRESGVPLTTIIPIKPNLTCSSTSSKTFTLEYGMGIVTDPFFTEGVIQGLKELGISGEQCYLREVNCPRDFGPRGYTAMAERTRADIRALNAGVDVLSSNDLVWIETPQGLWYRRIPYLWPVNAPNTWLLNIAKFKTHGMGVTLCCKNIQGTISIPYQEHCAAPTSSMSMKPGDRNLNYSTEITANYNRHLAEKLPRWDKPTSGLKMETWASRCTDNNLALRDTVGLHIIEGIYGRDGNGFHEGPNSGTFNTKEAWDYMTNIVIFGKNQVYVDNIGHWLAGHEPGNFGLFHLARDRGMCETINPQNIPVYEWKADGSATLTSLNDFVRTPLKTNYMQRNYNGQTEPLYHLCNERYEYPPEALLGVDRKADPQAFLLHQNKPNPFNPSTSIEFYLPKGGNARLEVYNASGQLMETLADGYYAAGSHMATWNTAGKSSGVYFYRFRSGDFASIRKMMLLK